MALLLAVIASAFAFLYLRPEWQASSIRVAMVSAFIPYATFLWLASVILFVIATRGWWRLLALPLVAGLVMSILWLRPYWPHNPTAPEGATTVRVFSANVNYSSVKPLPLARAISEADADIVVLLEVDPADIEPPAVAQALEQYPHRVGTPSIGYELPGYVSPTNTMVFSRIPIESAERFETQLHQYRVRLNDDGARFTLFTAHPVNMTPGADLWDREGRLLRDELRTLIDEPLIVVGDFNATPEQLTLRRILALGFTLGAQEAGGGWFPTFDADRKPIPPVIAIDHLLTNQYTTATSFDTREIPGSDHRGIVADVVVRTP